MRIQTLRRPIALALSAIVAIVACPSPVDALAKVGEVWKIVALSDTRRTTGCTK